MFAAVALLELLDLEVPARHLGVRAALASGVWAQPLHAVGGGAGQASPTVSVASMGSTPNIGSGPKDFVGVRATTMIRPPEVAVAAPEVDLPRLLVGKWEATIIGAGTFYELCNERPDDRHRRIVTFHEDGNYERSVEPMHGRWLAAGRFLAVQFRSLRGDWHDGDGRAGAAKHMVEVDSLDRLVVKPVGGLAATEHYRRCGSR